MRIQAHPQSAEHSLEPSPNQLKAAPFARWTNARVQLAIVALVVSALTNIRFFQREMKRARAAPEGGITHQFLERFAEFRQQLPARGTLGYLSQSAPDTDPQLAVNRLGLSRYAVVPCLLEPHTDQAWVLFDADDPQAVPQQAAQQGWQLVADAGNGLKLYRTPAAR